jgi:hypothetical protein
LKTVELNSTKSLIGRDIFSDTLGGHPGNFLGGPPRRANDVMDLTSTIEGF